MPLRCLIQSGVSISIYEMSEGRGLRDSQKLWEHTGDALVEPAGRVGRGPQGRTPIDIAGSHTALPRADILRVNSGLHAQHSAFPQCSPPSDLTPHDPWSPGGCRARRWLAGGGGAEAQGPAAPSPVSSCRWPPSRGNRCAVPPPRGVPSCDSPRTPYPSHERRVYLLLPFIFVSPGCLAVSKYSTNTCEV